MKSDASENTEPSDFHHGESNKEAPFEGINDPLRFVDRFRKHRKQSVEEVVLSATAVCDGIDTIKNDSVQLGRYLTALAEAKVITKAEAEKGELSKMSMISKIRKINEHRGIILHPNVANKICTGYSVLYELGLLIDKLPDEGNRADRLGEHLERLDGPLTRKWVQGLRESIAPNQRRKKAEESPTEDEEAPESAGVEDRHQVDAEIDESGDVSNIDESEDQNATMRKEASVPSSAKRAEVLIEEAGEPIAAALLIVSNSDDGAVERATEYARCQDLADQMAKDSAIFVFARMNVLLNIIRVVQIFHPVFRCANLYLLSGSDKLEATDCNVFAIFERGDGVFVDGVPNWKADDTPLQTVWQLLRGVPGRRLQIFADAPVAGWETPDFGEH